jgi:hypothetical protein
MDRLRRARPSPAMMVAFVALFAAMGGGGYAAFAAPTTKTGAKFYAPSDYLPPGDSNVDYGGVGLGQLFCGSSPNIEGNYAFAATLDNLPDGASITKVTAYYNDYDPNEQLTFQVGSHTPGVSDVLEEFAPATSTTGSTSDPLSSVEMTPTSPVVVDNASRRYFVAADFSACGTTVGTPGVDEQPSLQLDGVRVDYRLK